jgi:hypothetical protein
MLRTAAIIEAMYNPRPRSVGARFDYPAITNRLLHSNRVYADEVYQLRKALDEIDELRVACGGHRG